MRFVQMSRAASQSLGGARQFENKTFLVFPVLALDFLVKAKQMEKQKLVLAALWYRESNLLICGTERVICSKLLSLFTTELLVLPLYLFTTERRRT